MKLPVLYSRTSTGAIQQWQIVVDGNTFFTIEGQKDGKLTTATPTVCEGKNTGKANETSGEEQASKEAKAKWQKKIDSGYFEDIKDIDNETFYEPMLAHKYGDHDVVFPCYSQSKLDGVRCICRKDGMWSRGGKPIISAPHIREALEPLFAKNPSLIFDGELYCDKLKDNFNKIISLVKKSKPTKADLEESAKTIQYWIYDLPSSGEKGFKDRYKDLHALIETSETSNFPACLVLVDTQSVNNQGELDGLYGKYLTHGFEGQIIRSASGTYENKRSKYLLKRKEFMDSEYKILDVCEGSGNRSGTAGYMVLALPDGRTFKSNIKGTLEYTASLLTNKNKLIGKQATCKYFQLTPDGVPRFPYVIAIRDYE